MSHTFTVDCQLELLVWQRMVHDVLNFIRNIHVKHDCVSRLNAPIQSIHMGVLIYGFAPPVIWAFPTENFVTTLDS